MYENIYWLFCVKRVDCNYFTTFIAKPFCYSRLHLHLWWRSSRAFFWWYVSTLAGQGQITRLLAFSIYTLIRSDKKHKGSVFKHIFACYTGLQRPDTERFNLHHVRNRTTCRPLNVINVISNIKVSQDTHSHSSTTWMLLLEIRDRGTAWEREKDASGKERKVEAEWRRSYWTALLFESLFFTWQQSVFEHIKCLSPRERCSFWVLLRCSSSNFS